jgi:PAS domain S-box-containing protein
MVKNTIISLLLILSLLSLPLSSYADNLIEVGIYQNKPLVFIDSDGNIKGIYIDILEYIGSKEEWHIKYVPGSFSQALERLDKGEIDILVGIAYSKERAEKYDFTRETLLSNWAQIYTKKDSKIQSIPDLKDKKIAVLKGDIYYDRFKQLLKKFNIDGNFIELNDYMTVFEYVDERKADAGIISRLYGLQNEKRYNVERSPIVCCPIELRFALPKDKKQTPQLIKTIDRYLIALKHDNNSIYYHSLNRWLGGISISAFPAWLKLVLIGSGGLLLLFLAGIILLRVQVQNKTKRLKEELTQRKQIESELLESRERYRTLFEDSPISLWEEDFSEFKRYIDKLRGSGIKDFKTYFDENPEEIEKCASMVKIMDVNKATLKLYKADSKEYFLRSLDKLLKKESYIKFKEELIAISEGKKVFETETITTTLKGEKRHVNLRWSVAPGYEESLSRVLISVIDITEQKQAEQQLIQTKQEWEETFNAITDMITIHDKDYNILRANRAAQKILRLPSLERALKVKCFKYYHGTDGPPEGCPSCKCLTTGQPCEFELFEPHLNMFLEIRAMPRFDSNNQVIGLIHIVRDITERKNIEEAIKKAKIEWEMTFDNATELIALVDRDLRIIRCNRSFVEFTQKPMDELIGKRCTDLITSHPEKIEFGNIEGRTEIMTDNGRWLYLSFHPVVNEKGEFLHSILIGTDITMLKKTQQRLMSSEKELTQRIRELERFYEMAVGRELRMRELKKEIKKLSEELARYKGDGGSGR